MATSKSGAKTRTTKKSTTTKSTGTPATKTTTKTVAATPAKRTIFKKPSGEANYPAIILAEVVGTFILTLVALLTLQDIAPLAVGLTVAVLVFAVGAVSGAHLNPAVTFGLWSIRKLSALLIPVYWVAQFVGAMIAILALGLFSGTGYPLDFSHFGNLSWGILSVEVLGTAVFLFGLVAVATNQTLSQAGKAFGVGLSLMVGILVSTTSLTTLQSAKYSEYQKITQENTSQEAIEIPRELYIKGATLNPAVALASTERTESQLSNMSAQTTEIQYSRLSLEVILGTLVGAALGANLYLLVAYANRQKS